MYEENNEIKGIELLFEQGIIKKDEYENLRERIIKKSVESKEVLLFKDVFESYLSYLKRTVTKPTQLAYRSKIINFELYMYDKLSEELLFTDVFENFRLNDVKEYFEHMQKNNESLSYSQTKFVGG